MVQAIPRSKWILAAFLEASSETTFREKWITADDFSTAICELYKLNSTCAFTGNELIQVITNKSNEFIRAQMEIEDNFFVTEDHIGIFLRKYRQRKNTCNRKYVTCFYCVTKKGQYPPEPKKGNWYDNIVSLNQLTNYIVTCTSDKVYCFKTSDAYKYVLANSDLNVTCNEQDKSHKRKRVGTASDLMRLHALMMVSSLAVPLPSPNLSLPSQASSIPHQESYIQPQIQSPLQPKESHSITFWKSRNAHNLFCPTSDEIDSFNAIEN